MTGLGWLMILFLASKAKSSAPARTPGASPSTVALGTPAIARPPNLPPVPVKLEMILRSGKNEAVWLVQELASSNLAIVRPKLKALVGKVVPIDVRSGLVLKGRWDNNVFVPVT